MYCIELISEYGEQSTRVTFIVHVYGYGYMYMELTAYYCF